MANAAIALWCCAVPWCQPDTENVSATKGHRERRQEQVEHLFAARPRDATHVVRLREGLEGDDRLVTRGVRGHDRSRVASGQRRACRNPPHVAVGRRCSDVGRVLQLRQLRANPGVARWRCSLREVAISRGWKADVTSPCSRIICSPAFFSRRNRLPRYRRHHRAIDRPPASWFHAVVRRGPIPRRTHAIAPPCIETRTCP